jgi:predicted transcriptional regulator
MTFTVTLPDEIANSLVTLSPSERDALIGDALSDVWDTEDDMRLEEEAAIRRGIADDEAGRFVRFTSFEDFRDGCIARSRAK